MAEQITNYQCPACGGPLHFAGASGKLECEYCGSSFEVAEIEKLYQQKDEKAAGAFHEESEKQAAQEPAADWDAAGDGMHVYNCPSCGAELICDENTAATSCPYCGNPSIVPGQLSGMLKPDYVLPFKLDKAAAIAALKKHYGKKLLLPKAFRDQNHIEQIQGVYVPFWLFDMKSDADLSFNATRSHVHTEGDWEVTTTEHFRIRRAGTVEFARIPVDGSSKMPDDYMDSIEPFDFSELKPFSTAYMPGYLADKYDVSADESESRASVRCESSATQLAMRDVIGYDTVTPTGGDVHTVREGVKYAMMPVWMLSTKWKDQNYLFAMNAQTGKLVGDLPVDPMRYNLLRLAVAGGITLLMVLTGLGGAIAGLFL